MILCLTSQRTCFILLLITICLIRITVNGLFAESTSGMMRRTKTTMDHNFRAWTKFSYLWMILMKLVCHIEQACHPPLHCGIMDTTRKTKIKKISCKFETEIFQFAIPLLILVFLVVGGSISKSKSTFTEFFFSPNFSVMKCRELS